MRVVQLLSNVLADPVDLKLVRWELDPVQAIIALNLTSQPTSRPCPLCQVPSERLHSRYKRRLADLPWGRWSVRLGLAPINHKF